MPPITHLVVLMLENRSYDHLFGSLALSAAHDGIGADAWITDPLNGGDPPAPWKLPLLAQPPSRTDPIRRTNTRTWSSSCAARAGTSTMASRAPPP